MRRREREEAAAVARQRLAGLGAGESFGDRFGRPPLAERRAGPPGFSDEPAFFEAPVPVMAGPPGDLPGSQPLSLPAWARDPADEPGEVFTASVGRPLAPEPVRVPAPGRHAVDRPGATVGGRVEDWMDDRLPDAVRRRVALSGQHLLVLTGVVGVVLALVGWFTLRTGPGEEVAPRAQFVSQGTEPSASASGEAGASDASPATAGAGANGEVVVDVAGKVRRPGIVTLPAGSRVHDAIKRAGGALPGTRLTSLNLARVLTDGEQVLVGVAPAGAAPSGGSASGSGSSGSGSAGAPTGSLVNLNTAGLSELDTLPGVGPVTAQKILDWRGEHGSFSSIDELLEVDGIGDKTLADLKPRVTL